jgi:hypothetical protein
MIKLTLNKRIKRSDWAKASHSLIKQYCDSNSADRFETSFLIVLPERGRCFKKSAGTLSLTTHNY